MEKNTRDEIIKQLIEQDEKRKQDLVKSVIEEYNKNDLSLVGFANDFGDAIFNRLYELRSITFDKIEIEKILSE